MYNYQKSNRYFAQAAEDIKDLVESELVGLGATDVSHAYKGLYFNGDKEVLYKVNLYTRLINRILAPLISFDCHSENYLYKTAYEIEWEKLLNNDDTFAIYASVSQSNITHSKFASLKLKDAIVDRFRDKTGKRPDVDTRNPKVWFNLHIEKNHAVISIDTSGGSLHRRGYRKGSVEAPMIETLAASIIALTEWDMKKPLYDPLCGSGTLLCEAYLAAANIPPSFMRERFGFENLPDFDKKLWKKIKSDSEKNIRKIEPDLISGSDISIESVRAAEKNLAVIDNYKLVNVKQKNIFDIKELKDKVIVCNPPYGIRLKPNHDLSKFYKELGDFLKQKCTNSTAFIYFGDRKYLKNIGLRPKWKRPLQNGGLDGRLAKFELY